jgi:hypothetical protein
VDLHELATRTDRVVLAAPIVAGLGAAAGGHFGDPGWALTFLGLGVFAVAAVVAWATWLFGSGMPPGQRIGAVVASVLIFPIGYLGFFHSRRQTFGVAAPMGRALLSILLMVVGAIVGMTRG